jgi:ankyrin repeat protein
MENSNNNNNNKQQQLHDNDDDDLPAAQPAVVMSGVESSNDSSSSSSISFSVGDSNDSNAIVHPSATAFSSPPSSDASKASNPSSNPSKFISFSFGASNKYPQSLKLPSASIGGGSSKPSFVFSSSSFSSSSLSSSLSAAETPRAAKVGGDKPSSFSTAVPSAFTTTSRFSYAPSLNTASMSSSSIINLESNNATVPSLSTQFFPSFKTLQNKLLANKSLIAATEESNIAKFNEAVEAGADVNYRSEGDLKDLKGYSLGDCNSSLHIACWNGHIPIINRCIELKADVNAKATNSYEHTPLDLAAKSGRVDVVQILLANGATVSEGKDYVMLAKNSLLYAAAVAGDLAKFDEAVEAGADINYESDNLLRDSKGYSSGSNNTCLHVACLYGYLPIVNRLLDLDANINAINSNIILRSI